MSTGRVIFVDDEASVRVAVEQWLELAGLTVVVCARAREALEHVVADDEAVLVTDVKMPDMDGLALLAAVLERDADRPVVLLTGHGDIAMAVEAMRGGAYDFIEKPFAPERLVDSIRRACEKRALVLDNRRLRVQVEGREGIPSRIIGTSAQIESVRRSVLELAQANVHVVLRGETGTGKELVARCLHEYGPRQKKPFVAINCGAMPENLFESEFFGHEVGAFTGAVTRRAGKFEHAHGGTLFMDEIESMPLSLQVKVLRALQENTVERLGSHKSITVDVRTIAAAKDDLLDLVSRGRFREDLYYRLNVAELHLPPLRERRDDIPLLFEFFATGAARRHGREPRALGAQEQRYLMSHEWRGNVRELKNAAERHAIGLGLASGRGSAPPSGDEGPRSLAAEMEDFERSFIERTLEACRGDIKTAMERLDLPRRTLNEKMVRLGIDRQKFVPRG